MLIDRYNDLKDKELLKGLFDLFIPRRDNLSLAVKLLDHFGDLSKVINAKSDDLLKLSEVGPTALYALKITQSLFNHVIMRDLSKRSEGQSDNNPNLKKAYEDLCPDINNKKIGIIYNNSAKEIVYKHILSFSEAAAKKTIFIQSLKYNATKLVVIFKNSSRNLKISPRQREFLINIITSSRSLSITVINIIIVNCRDEIRFYKNVDLYLEGYVKDDYSTRSYI